MQENRWTARLPAVALRVNLSLYFSVVKSRSGRVFINTDRGRRVREDVRGRRRVRRRLLLETEYPVPRRLRLPNILLIAVSGYIYIVRKLSLSMANRNNPTAVWDFTAPSEVSQEKIKKFLQKYCKKWCYQLELSESGYEHWQGRISLKSKERLTTLRKKLDDRVHWSITSNNGKDDDFYVSKEETRVKGPWKDSDPYIPRQVREITNLYPWQKDVIKISEKWDTRTVHCIIDQGGNIGKSTLCMYMAVHGLARKLPYCNDFKDVMRMVCDLPTSKTYLIDMPKAISKEKLFQMYSAIEEVKNGYAYDDRYHFQEKFFDSPAVWVFTNKVPDESLLSRDRWRLHTIEDNELVDWNSLGEGLAAQPGQAGQ